MHARRTGNVTIRPLQACDAATIVTLFERLSDRSRAQRFGGAKPRLTEQDLALLSLVDDTHHVLVAYVDDDPQPAGIARLVRTGDAAEVAFAVADAYQRRGIGSLLMDELACDARASGIKQLSATVRGDNQAAATLIARASRRVDVRWCGGERELVAAL